MAPTKPALDLNAMISAGKEALDLEFEANAKRPTDRLRRKNEAIAQDVFGKNRRSSAPGAGMNNRKSAAAVPSLASRIGTGGVTKVC
jgi:hypothetical protein